MKGRISLLLLLSCLVAGLGWYLLQFRDPAPGQGSAVNPLGREAVEDSKSPQETSRDTRAAKQHIGAAMPEEAANESALALQIAQLTVAVERLEAVADKLDSRIVRSRLAVPSLEERRAQLLRAEERLNSLRKAAAEKTAMAQVLAGAKGFEIDAQVLLEGRIPEALEKDPQFVAALDKALAEHRLIRHFEKQLGELRFSSVVEGLPEK